MNTVAKIVCKTVGAGGLALSCFDAFKVSKFYAKTGGEHAQEHYMEKTYFSSRTTDTVSYTSNAMRDKVFDIRSRNPLPSAVGTVKGGVKGFAYSIINSLPMIVCSSFALFGKNAFSKAGAIGVGVVSVWKILRDGFGVGKSNPMH